jgi:multiple sugar transport system ATP-binding protein
LIAGLEDATSGTIRIGDRTVNNVPPKDRDIAMVFQNYALYPHMTVFKNMAFGLKMRRTPKAEIDRKVREIARMLGVERLLDRRPAALSGGERQRVAVGRAIVRKPQVFLFDEPLSNLDAALRVQMRTELKSLHHDLQTTMIYVTHDQEEAMTLGDRIIVMKGGVVQQSGSPLEVYNLPANRFVAGFIGTPAMNFLVGRLEDEGDAMSFASSAGRLPLPAKMAAALKPHCGTSVVLGIRSEHLRLDGGGSGLVEEAEPDRPGRRAALADVLVRVVEPLGDSINVHLLTSADDALVARVPPNVAVSPERKVKVLVDMPHVHIFSADEDGKRLA